MRLCEEFVYIEVVEGHMLNYMKYSNVFYYVVDFFGEYLFECYTYEMQKNLPCRPRTILKVKNNCLNYCKCPCDLTNIENHVYVVHFKI